MRGRVSGLALATLASGLLGALPAAQAAGSAPYVVSGDRIEEPLLGLRGDPDRGRAIVADRRAGLCLLCHQAPVPEERSPGNLSTDLAGAGSRWTAAQLRLRVVDARRLNATSVMPAFHRTEGLNRVGAAWRDRPILDAQQVEDVVAYLERLK
jgi:sulfur-oxidizing protein SoxX